MDAVLIIGAIAVPALGLLATPWGLPVLAWLIGNPVGRVVAVIGLAVAAVGIAFLVGRKSGVDRIQAQATQARIDAIRDRIIVDESIRKLPPAKRREELSKWAR